MLPTSSSSALAVARVAEPCASITSAANELVLSAPEFFRRVVEAFAFGAEHPSFAVLSLRASVSVEGAGLASQQDLLSLLAKRLRSPGPSNEPAPLRRLDILGFHVNGSLGVLLPGLALAEGHALAREIVRLPRIALAKGLAIGVVEASVHGADARQLLATVCHAADRAAGRRAPAVALGDFRVVHSECCRS